MELIFGLSDVVQRLVDVKRGDLRRTFRIVARGEMGRRFVTIVEANGTFVRQTIEGGDDRHADRVARRQQIEEKSIDFHRFVKLRRKNVSIDVFLRRQSTYVLKQIEQRADRVQIGEEHVHLVRMFAGETFEMFDRAERRFRFDHFPTFHQRRDDRFLGEFRQN